MRRVLKEERRKLQEVIRTLDRQAATVLTVAVALVFLQLWIGDRAFFYQHLGGRLPVEWQELGAWSWWFGVQGVLGFVGPVALLMLMFKRRPAEIGLGLGDWKLAATLAGLYLPLVVIGTWVLSADPAFQRQYPHLQEAAFDWRLFFLYELMFVFYWVGWEYLWRGFVLFGTAPAFGFHAIFVQMVPFALLHADKPPVEALLSILGGVALGALVWRCRSFWIAVPIHAAQMLILDLWCTLRLRTGVNGLGPAALWEMLR